MKYTVDRGIVSRKGYFGTFWQGLWSKRWFPWLLVAALLWGAYLALCWFGEFIVGGF